MKVNESRLVASPAAHGGEDEVLGKMQIRKDAESDLRNTAGSKFFHRDELKFYRFGLTLGLANILRNGFRLGPKKTLGKILQPINSYTRFPEYDFCAYNVQQYQESLSPARRLRVLDVGSPKCFGLYLAYHCDVEIHLTDIDSPSVEEAEILWNAVKSRSRGKALFSLVDVRSSKYDKEEFDVVYSMSVIEHVEGQNGDSEGMREMLRVLKPGGLLLVTVPIGPRYIQQDRIGFQGAARNTGDRNRYFFQRIYTPLAVDERIISAAANARLSRAVTVWRKTNLISKFYRRLGTDLRGLLGGFNPVLSAVVNDSQEGILAAPGDYGELHLGSDIYGDLMLAWQKESSSG